MILEFKKVEGAGNDFLLFDIQDFDLSLEALQRVLKVNAPTLCDRRFGVGGDGIILIEQDAGDSEPVIRMHYYNADGGEAICNNGMRAVAAYARVKLPAFKDLEKFKLLTSSGEVNIDCLTAESFRTSLKGPSFKPNEIPSTSAGELIDAEIETNCGVFRGTALSVGNPHFVVFVDDLENYPVSLHGNAIENNALFPERTNVEFVKIISPTEVRMRVWERGVGETLACGTGNCAVISAGVVTNRLEGSIILHALGGSFELSWEREQNIIKQTGPARLVFEGRIEI